MTHLAGYAAAPVFFHHQDRLLFSRDLNWPGPNPGYALFAIDLTGEQVQDIHIPSPALIKAEEAAD